MNILEKAKEIVTDPNGFFDSVKGEKISDALKFIAVLALAAGFIGGIANFFTPEAQAASAAAGVSGSLMFIGFLFGFMLGYFLIAVLSYFVIAALMHVFAMLLGGKGNYTASYKAYAYGAVPQLLLAWLPVSLLGSIPDMVFSVLIGLWALYVTGVGVSKLHSTSLGRGLGIVILTDVIILIIAVILVLVGITVLSALPAFKATGLVTGAL